MHRLITLALIALLLLPAHGQAAEGEPWLFDLGPIISRRMDIHGDVRWRALGPFLERALADEGQTLTAVRPLYSHVDDPAAERSRSEYLWPLAYSKTFREEHSGRILLGFWTRFDTEDPKSRYRFWLIPVYFQGRDAHGENYYALFPVGGHINEFLGRDKIKFWAFPLYMRTELNEVVSRSYLWPIVSHTDGRGIYRFRVFPFYGQNRHRDRYSKKFIMWPFWTTAEYFYEGSSGKGYILFPIYGRLKLDDQQSWMVLPPLFRVSRGDRMNMALLPWPFIHRRTGEIQQTYVWPLWGQKKMRGVESQFLFWPLLYGERLDHLDELTERTYALPFYYSETRTVRHALESDPDTPPPLEQTANYKKIWPLFSYTRDGEDLRVRTLDLWPLKNTPSIERNYAPLWTLFSHVRHQDAADTELLWGLYRRERRGEEQAYTSLFPLVDWSSDEVEEVRRWNLLKGLIGYERQGADRRLRLLYLLRINLTGVEEP